jgi:hypothetical protein
MNIINKLNKQTVQFQNGIDFADMRYIGNLIITSEGRDIPCSWKKKDVRRKAQGFR